MTNPGPDRDPARTGGVDGWPGPGVPASIGRPTPAPSPAATPDPPHDPRPTPATSPAAGRPPALWAPPPAQRAARGWADTVAGLLRGLGEVLITAGVVVLLFVVYELYVTDLVNHRQQAALRRQLLHSWASPQPAAAARLPVTAVPFGTGFAILRVPRLGRRYAEVVVEGTGYDQLALGVGHYVGSAPPGGVGNFVLSGHRVTHGRPFFHLDAVRAGDAVVVQTRAAYYVYTVTGTEVVDPTDVATIAPVPDRPGVAPSARYLTLTTCNPRYSAATRLIVHGLLASVRPTTAGPPPALTAPAAGPA